MAGIGPGIGTFFIVLAELLVSGVAAKKVVENARKKIATMIHADTPEGRCQNTYFT